MSPHSSIVFIPEQQTMLTGAPPSISKLGQQGLGQQEIVRFSLTISVFRGTEKDKEQPTIYECHSVIPRWKTWQDAWAAASFHFFAFPAFLLEKPVCHPAIRAFLHFLLGTLRRLLRWLLPSIGCSHFRQCITDLASILFKRASRFEGKR